MKARRCMRVYMYITNGDNTLLSLYLTYQYFVSRRAGRKSEKKSLKSKCDGIYEKRLRHYFYYVILRINAEQFDRIRHAWVRFHCLITIIYFCVYIYIYMSCMRMYVCIYMCPQNGAVTLPTWNDFATLGYIKKIYFAWKLQNTWENIIQWQLFFPEFLEAE